MVLEGSKEEGAVRRLDASWGLALLLLAELGCSPVASPGVGTRPAIGNAPAVAAGAARPEPGEDPKTLLEDIDRAKDAYALPELYAKSRRFLALFPGHEAADDVRYDLALQLVSENLLTPDTSEAEEARALLDVLSTGAHNESLRFDASLVRLKFAKRELREKLTEALLAAFPKHPDLTQVYQWWVQVALEDGETKIAAKWAERVLAAGELGEIEGLYRDVLTRAALLGRALPKAEPLLRTAGKVVVVDFFASWCEPCVAELPRLRALHEKKKALGLSIVSVSLDEDPRAFSSFMAREKLPWTVVRSPRGSGGLADACAVSDLPTYVVLDRAGHVRATDLRRESFYALVDALLEIPPTRRR